MTRSGRLVAAVAISMGLTGPAAAQAPAKAHTAAITTTLPPDEARERNLGTYVELLRSDLRSLKVAVITEMMQFSEAEDRVFWPVYREHEVIQRGINDDRLALIEEYAAAYPAIAPATAASLVGRALDLEGRQLALKQQYFAKLKSVLSPAVAAKVMQIEHQIQLLVDVQVAASLPVLK